ncbi:MAG: thiamine phosphate synthase [Planctomycetota bacterium]
MADRLKAIFVTEAEGELDTTLAVAGRAMQGGASAVLVRRPKETAREVFELTRRLRPLTRQLNRLLLVSDRVDVALATAADGVHLGDRSLPPVAARRILRPGMLVGRSVHNLDEAGQAEGEGADYLFLGPLFKTRSHPTAKPLGLDAYREAVLRTKIPILAIGGITGENVRLVAQAGGRGAAAIGAFYDTADPADAARAFRAAFAS